MVPVKDDRGFAGEGSDASRGHVVLVVDDETDIRDSLKELFDSSLPDAQTVTAGSGAAALEALSRQPVDLILTDYKMPGMNGMKFLAEARKAHGRVPQILMTAFPDLDLAVRAVDDKSIEAFLTKPLEPAVVVDTVRRILHDRHGDALRDRAFARSPDLLRRQIDTRH